MTAAPPPARTAFTGLELVSLACSIGLVPLNSTMIAVAIPAIAGDWSVPPTLLFQWLVSSYLLVNIVAQSPAGKLGDRWGHMRMLQLGQLIFALGSVIGFLATVVPVLAAARVLMALGGAVMVPAAMASVRISLPPEKRAKAFGLFGAVMALSAACGPLVGGEIVARFGWAALFLVNIAPLAVVGFLELRAPRRHADATGPRQRQRFDFLGSALLGLGLSLLVIGVRDLQAWAPLVGLAVVLLAAFVWWERRASDPVIDLRLLSRRAFAAGAGIVGLQNFAMYALLFELPVVFARSFQATPAQSGRVLLAMTLAMVVGSTLGGQLAARLGPRRAAMTGTAVALVGSLLLLVPLVGLQSFLPALLALGLGLGLSTPAANAASMAAAQPHESGMASAASGTLRYLGGIAGVAMVSALAAGDDLLAAMHTSAWVFAAALGLAALLATRIPSGTDAGHKAAQA